jgi:sugar transferase (PEP-CTERM/EpsH1 system associated)
VLAAPSPTPSSTIAVPREPLRVMHVTYKFGVGGMEVGIAKLVNGLDATRVASAICSSVPGDSLKERLRPGVQLFELSRRRGNDLNLVADLYRLFKRERPHVVHTHRWGTLLEGTLAARLAGVPFVVHGEHGTLETRWRNAWIQRRLWHHVDRVLSVSSRLAERMAQEMAFPLDRITVIRNGLDLNRFQPVADKTAARQALGISPDQLVIGTVGRTVPVKDHPTFLRALARVRDAGVRFTAVIAGTGPAFQDTVRLAESLNLTEVQLLGNRDDVDTVLRAFDIFVLSSTSEGLSNTIQEAMATGLPVVATNVGGADELVVEGQTGILTPSGDDRAMADALLALARDDSRRSAFGRRGAERARTHFGIERMFRDYENMYLSLREPAASPMGWKRRNEA